MAKILIEPPLAVEPPPPRASNVAPVLMENTAQVV